jgi:hypothetical protein
MHNFSDAFAFLKATNLILALQPKAYLLAIKVEHTFSRIRTNCLHGNLETLAVLECQPFVEYFRGPDRFVPTQEELFLRRGTGLLAFRFERVFRLGVSIVPGMLARSFITFKGLSEFSGNAERGNVHEDSKGILEN